MPTVASSGTQTATLDTEHTLATITDAGTYVLVVDTAAMALGDTLTLRIKTKVLSGGTLRGFDSATYRHAQPADKMVKQSIPVPSDVEAVFTLEQTDGTGRSYPWKVMAL